MSDAPALGGLTTISDIDSASDFEKKHTPFVSVERNGDRVLVEVEVGRYVSHPNDPDHFIQWIEILVADAPVARFDFVPVAADPHIFATLNLPAGTPFRVVESCNLHGLWAADARS